MSDDPSAGSADPSGAGAASGTAAAEASGPQRRGAGEGGSASPLAVILGAGPGIGLALGRRLGLAGYEVGLVGRAESALAQLGEQLAADGVPAGWAVADVAEPASLTRALQGFLRHKGRLDVLHHNVSHYRAGGAEEVAADDLLADLAAGAASLLTAVRVALPALRAAGGCVLATGSGAADRPAPGALTLGVQKAALRALVAGLAADLAGQGVLATSVTVHGNLAEGTAFAPSRVAEVLFEAAEQRRQPVDTWQSVIDYRG